MSSTTSTSSKGDKSGGGQSSLKYLFGSQEQQSTESQPPPPKTVSISLPPYGTDITDPARAPAPQPNFIHPSQGGNILTNRPSTKVKSVPGGQSTLGYLFGDK